MRTKIYGPQLMLDCYGADPGQLADVARIYSFLEELPSQIGMQKIGPPVLARFTDSGKAGVTGFVLIVTSHVSIHTYALKGCLFLDVFSCKPFDWELVIEAVKNAFSPKRIKRKLIHRGTEFPVQNLPRGVKKP